MMEIKSTWILNSNRKTLLENRPPLHTQVILDAIDQVRVIHYGLFRVL